MKTSYMALAAALVAFAPAMASAQSVAASLSASFGSNGDDVTIDADNTGLSTTINPPTSISVSAAAGDMAVSTGVSTGNSSATSAGASNADTNFTPYADINYNGDVYTTNVGFEPIDPDYINTLISEFCENNLDGVGFEGTTEDFFANFFNFGIPEGSPLGDSVEVSGNLSFNC